LSAAAVAPSNNRSYSLSALNDFTTQ
jgi:hypothetical protein